MRICALASGSSGNATWISAGSTSVLVDCGASARDVTARLARIGTHPSRLDGILITHAHWDHYRSAGTLNARWGVPVFVDPSTARALARKGHRTSWRRIREARPVPERIGDLDIRALDTVHGAREQDGRTVAYRLDSSGASAAVVTDLGGIEAALLEALRGVDAIVLEANHDETIVRRKLSDWTFARDWPYLSWVLGRTGHLSNRQCGDALSEILTERRCHVFLAHLSENHAHPARDNNDHQICLDTVRGILRRRGVPEPTFHRTRRIGRLPAELSDCVEI